MHILLYALMWQCVIHHGLMCSHTTWFIIEIHWSVYKNELSWSNEQKCIWFCKSEYCTAFLLQKNRQQRIISLYKKCCLFVFKWREQSPLCWMDVTSCFCCHIVQEKGPKCRTQKQAGVKQKNTFIRFMHRTKNSKSTGERRNTQTSHTGRVDKC